LNKLMTTVMLALQIKYKMCMNEIRSTPRNGLSENKLRGKTCEKMMYNVGEEVM